jgi:hypothetical protein
MDNLQTANLPTLEEELKKTLQPLNLPTSEEELKETFQPPNLPTLEEELNGTFHYIKSNSNKIMLSTAYKAITQTKTWNYIKDMESGFEKDSEYIYKKIQNLGYNGHSGSSFICTLRDMQFIACFGEKAFKEKYIEYENKAATDLRIQERRRIIAELELESEI